MSHTFRLLMETRIKTFFNIGESMSYITDKINPPPANPKFSTDIFPDNTKEQCWQCWINSFPASKEGYFNDRDSKEYWVKNIVIMLRQEIGVSFLTKEEKKCMRASSFGPWEDTDYKTELYEFFKKGFEGDSGDKNIKYAFWIVEILAKSYYSHKHYNEIELNFNFYLRQANIGYQIINKELVPYIDETLLQSAVHPALSLLDNKIFKEAREYYLQSFNLYEQNNFESALDAISKAYEAVIKIILKEKKVEMPSPPVLSSLINKIKEHKIIPGIDQNIHNALIKLIETPSLIRNQGGGHSHIEGEKRVKADEKMVLLMIHHTSSNILYLAQSCLNF